MNRASWKELWSYRELFFFLAWRDFKIRYRQTVFGAAWALIQPLVTMTVFAVLFGRLAKVPSDGVPYPVFAYTALLPWTYFSGALSSAGSSLLGSSELIRKVYFPRVTIPAATLLVGFLDFAIGSVLLFAMMAYYHMYPGWGLLLWPVLLTHLFLLALGLGLLLSAVNVRFRDVKYALPFAIQIWLFLTPVIYPVSMIPARYRFLTALNPLTGIIEGFRASVFSGMHMDWNLLAASATETLLALVVGVAYFRNTERAFADVI